MSKYFQRDVNPYGKFSDIVPCAESLWAHLQQEMQCQPRDWADLDINELERHIAMQQY